MCEHGRQEPDELHGIIGALVVIGALVESVVVVASVAVVAAAVTVASCSVCDGRRTTLKRGIGVLSRSSMNMLT